jgi:hypothetical protein
MFAVPWLISHLRPPCLVGDFVEDIFVGLVEFGGDVVHGGYSVV